MSKPYNGYNWRQRSKIMPAFRKATGKASPFEGDPCSICNDPDRPASEWHSEDYSEPFIFEPPASYPVCKPCHGRLHNRFKPEGQWALFCLHLEAGGYGSEFTRLRTAAERRALLPAAIGKTLLMLPKIRDRPAGTAWWRNLTLDPESLEAPWARPRPLRPRPDAEAFRHAFETVRMSEADRRFLLAHAQAPRRTATMRELAMQAVGRPDVATANRDYGKLAHRLTDALGWSPDTRKDGSPSWMTLVAEGRWPPGGREHEWTMVPSAAEAVLRWMEDR